MNRLLALVASAALPLAACEVTIGGGKPSTKEIAQKATESLKAQGIPVQSIRCPEDFTYSKGHDTLLCEATMVGGLIVDAPIQFHDATNFEVTPQLPGVVTASATELHAEFERIYGKDGALVCPPKLVFWKGKDSVTCQVTVEGETSDMELTVREGHVSFELPSERYIGVTGLEVSFVDAFQQKLSLAAKVDCGQPRVALRKPGRKVECTATWDGGRATLLDLFTSPTTDLFLVTETEGLHAAQLNALLSLYSQLEPGSAWACREGTQIVRGKPFTCDLVTAGHKRTPTKIVEDEAAGKITFDPPP